MDSKPYIGVLRLWIFIYLQGGALGEQLECTLSSFCTCFQNPFELEYQCPLAFNETHTVMHIDSQLSKVLIDCYDLSEFPIQQLLPALPSQNRRILWFENCPSPQPSISAAVKQLGLEPSKLEIVKFQRGIFVEHRIPEGFLHNLTSLRRVSLAFTDLQQIPSNAFHHLPNLISLDLKSNNLTLQSDHFVSLQTLQFLDLAMNRIVSLPPNVFKTLSHLRILDLWKNNLVTLNATTFLGLNRLESLELSFNKIRNIDANTFHSLNNLVNLSMQSNRITHLPPSVFWKNTRMENLRLSRNTNLTVSPHQFANLTNLKILNLFSCRIRFIPTNAFDSLLNLTILNLKDNELENLPQDIFKNLRRLTDLDLSMNRLSWFPNNLFKGVPRLRSLNLQSNRFQVIKTNSFVHLLALETLLLNSNLIHTIERFGFVSVKKLKTLDISNNNLTFNWNVNSSYSRHGSPFAHLNSLERINLSYNRIEQFIDSLVLLKIHLSHINMSHNRIRDLDLFDLQTVSTHRIQIDVSANDIRHVNFERVNGIAEYAKSKFNAPVLILDNNPIRCDCNALDLVRYFRLELEPTVRDLVDIKVEEHQLSCADPPELRDINVQRVDPMLLTCPYVDHCPGECDCRIQSATKMLQVNCDNRNLTELPNLGFKPDGKRFQHIELTLRNNMLTSVVEQPNIIDKYANVTNLILTNNQIHNVTWLPPNLEILDLDNNRLQSIPLSIMQNLASLTNVHLNNNMWSCGCQAKNFSKFLRRHALKIDPTTIKCYNSNQLLINIDEVDVCNVNDQVFLYTATFSLAFLTIFVSIVALYFRYEPAIKVWLFAHNMFLFWVGEDELDKNKQYDAFISYSHKDESFVTEHLLPVLETGVQPYSLCLHYRNWIPGDFISEQVVRSVQESRRTIVILSANFVESVWGKMEFRTAHAEALREGRARVIVILYGDLDVDALDEELKLYFRTNTYLKWGDPWFWQKLRYALPHRPRIHSNKHNNIMMTIDDKLSKIINDKGQGCKTIDSYSDNLGTSDAIDALPSYGDSDTTIEKVGAFEDRALIMIRK